MRHSLPFIGEEGDGTKPFREEEEGVGTYKYRGGVSKCRFSKDITTCTHHTMYDQIIRVM